MANDERAIWIVRAGRDGEFVEIFSKEKLIAVAHGEVGDLTGADEQAIVARVREELPPGSTKVFHIAAMLRRLAIDIQPGDWVIMNVPQESNVLAGVVRGPYAFQRLPELRDYSHTRPVEWLTEVKRHALPPEAKASLRTPQALFLPGAQGHWRAALEGGSGQPAA